MLDVVGTALCLLSAACFGALGIFGKLSYADGVTPAQLLLFRFAIAAVRARCRCSLVRPALRRMPVPRPVAGRSTGRVVATALALGAVGYAMQSTLYFTALKRMDASLLSLIFYTYPVLVTIGAVLLRRTRLTRARVAALVVASLGTGLVLLGAASGSLDLVGALLGVGTAVTYTGYILVAETVVGVLPPVVLATLVLVGASVSLGIRAWLTGDLTLDFTAGGWLWLVGIALVSTVGAILTFFAGLQRVGASNAAILSTLEPVVTTTLAAADPARVPHPGAAGRRRARALVRGRAAGPGAEAEAARGGRRRGNCARGALRDLAVDVEPPAVLADEARAFVQDADVTRPGHVGRAELDDAGRVAGRAVDDVEDLQAAPPRVVGEVEALRPRRAVPRGEQPVGVAVAERLEPRPHQRLGRRRPLPFVHPDSVATRCGFSS